MSESAGCLWIGNHPATDLCNTEPVVGGRRLDLLSDLDALIRWVPLAGVTSEIDPAAISGAEAERSIRFVHRLRAALRAVLEPATPDADATNALNRVLREQPGSLVVDLSSTDVVSWVASTGAAQLRLDIVTSVVDIFRHDRRLIRKCANPACELLFLDLSKSRRRRWCDMTTCGNRAKAAAHYARGRPS
ncbi:MAG: CGNR zinc finger domain-containing protein [Acidimicrobiia bacterium]